MTAAITARASAPVDWDEVIARFVSWAEATDAVRGVVMVGSRTRTDQPADAWSDLDLFIVTRNRDSTIHDPSWLEQVGPVWATLVHPGPLPDAPVRQIVFAGGFDVDLVALPPERFGGDQTDEAVADLLARGHGVLVDKDRLLGDLPDPGTGSVLALPSDDEFLWAINDLFVQFVWASKHLRRGNVWQAMDDVNCYMRKRVLSLVEWQALAAGRATASWKGAESGGRGLESWADPRVLDVLPATFATYSSEGVAISLRNLLDFLGWVGPEIAEALDVHYPLANHRDLSRWLDDTLGPLLPQAGRA